MEQLHNGFTLDIPSGVFPLSTDSMLLSDFVRLPAHAQVLDLGAGGGTLGLLLCAKDAGCRVTGVELDPAAHNAAQDNTERNGLKDRLINICADLRRIPEFIPPWSFHVCVSNPPYFDGGPASYAVPTARREDCCTLPELIHSAAWALKYGGDFFLVHRPERMAQIIALASAAGLEPKRLRLVRHRAKGGVSLILLACRKGAKPGLVWEEMTLFCEDGSPTDAYRELYHL